MKRFFKNAAAASAEGGFAVLLDGKAVLTPARAKLLVPTLALAEAIAAEWQGQGEKIDAKSMPLMRLACTAIDRIGPQVAAVVDEILGYGGSDLLCYRAMEPVDLVARQAKSWQPWLDWAARRFQVHFEVFEGISTGRQPVETLARLKVAVGELDAFALAGLHALVTGYGSLVLGLAAYEGAAAPEVAWAASRLDEAYQIEKWGLDPEAAKKAELLKTDLDDAHRFLEFFRK